MVQTKKVPTQKMYRVGKTGENKYIKNEREEINYQLKNMVEEVVIHQKKPNHLDRTSDQPRSQALVVIFSP